MYKWWKAISSSVRIGIIVGIAVVIVILSYVYNSTNSNLVLGILAVLFAALIVTIVFEVKAKKEKQAERQEQLKAEARERQSKGIVSPQAPMTCDPVYRLHVKSGKFQCLVDDAWRYIGDADFNALEKGDRAIIRHEPTVDYPNRANVYIEGVHVGILPEVYSEGLRQDYGDYYGFNGHLVRKGTGPVPGSIERYFLTIEILLKDPLPISEKKPPFSEILKKEAEAKAKLEAEKRELQMKEFSEKRAKLLEEQRLFDEQHPIVRYVHTKVRGCKHYIDDDDFDEFDEGDEITVKHEPSSRFPELTYVYVSGLQIGTLKKDLAEDLVRDYGKGFTFRGTILEKENNGILADYPYDILIEIEIRK